MAFENLPGIFPILTDGLLQLASSDESPVVLVMGTAARGDTENFYRVVSPSQAASDFGRTDGTLIRGMYEVLAGGAGNIRLYRVGATSAKVTGIGEGALDGLTVETIAKDADAGSMYKIFWDDSEKRLRVWRTSDDLLIYDNNPAYPAAAVDENEVIVSGSADSDATDIGTAGAPVVLYSCANYTAGSDGITLSRMELFEAYTKGYELLKNEDFDLIVPMNIYLDDENVKDMTLAEVAAINGATAPWYSTPAYPEPGSAHDVLGEVFVQEYEGETFFWWDMDADGQAEIYPDSIGSADATHDAFGVLIGSGEYHEANFGYQLADFCYRQSEDNAEVIGVIGVLPPLSWSLKDVSNWIGRAPVYEEDSNGDLVIASASDNGTGLLGLKWMAGRKANSGTGLHGHIIDNIDGAAYGGFIATDSGWPDGTQLKDRNDHLVDLGKYISVVAGQAVMANSTSDRSYVATAAPTYGGFVARLAPNSAPTNKILPGVRLPFRVSVAKLDILAGFGYVMLQDKPKGIVVADAPTGSRPDCDYRRLSTIRIVKAVVDAVRGVGEPFLGESISGATLAALETAINQVLLKLQKAGYLQRYDVAVSSTPSMQIQGKVNVELVLVPAFEMRQITVNISLAAQ